MDVDEFNTSLTIKVSLVLNFNSFQGTNTNLEKPYFRLTSAPDPADVRPEHILKKTLKLLK